LHPFVPPGFAIPPRLERPGFVLRPLTVHDLVRDYDAVMTSVAHLSGVFGPGSDWPSPDLTLEQDLIDLGWHQKEFQLRRSFAYTVVDPSDTRCLGCAYINPSRRDGFDADAFCWARASDAASLDAPLFAAFKEWIATDWPFARVAFPGREDPFL
jgi:hypothetical protein